MKLWRLLLIGLALAVVAPLSRAADAELTVEALDPKGEFEYDLTTGMASASKGVLVRYGDALLTADRVQINQSNAVVQAEGHVRIVREGQTWTGDKLGYNFKEHSLEASDFRSGQPPLFVAGQAVVGSQSTNTYIATNAYVTTDDFSTPFQKISAKSIVIVPGKYVTARGATVWVGGVPVMYWPYYRHSLDRQGNYYEPLPGYRSRYGAYLQNYYHWFWEDKMDGVLRADYYTKRGFGAGADVNPHLGKFGDPKLSYYNINDRDTVINTNNPATTRDRQRFNYEQEMQMSSNTVAKLVARYQSDPMVLHDFFEAEYRKNVQPNSFFELNHHWSNWSLDTLAQPRVNHFFETVERLPDIKLSGLRQQLGESPFFYESDNNLGWYHRAFADPTLTNYSAWRADTFHQILLPTQFFGWLNVTPRVGGRFTEYGEIESPTLNEHVPGRWVFNTGMEVSTKASRVWEGAHSDLLEVNGLRHIVEPGVNYVFVPRPNIAPSRLPQFDYELGSYRLLPIDYPDYNAIDSIDSQNVMRLSLHNKVQTKRKLGIDNLLNWDLYTDWRLNPRATQNKFADVFSTWDFAPRSWLVLSEDFRFGPGEGRVKELDHRLTLVPGNVWSLSVGNRYIRKDPALSPEGQNIYYTRLFYRFNENYGFRAYLHYEAQTRTLQEQYYTLYRDFRSWTGALTLRVRDNVGSRDDVTIAISFSLKAFPKFGVGGDADQPERLVGG